MFSLSPPSSPLLLSPAPTKNNESQNNKKVRQKISKSTNKHGVHFYRPTNSGHGACPQVWLIYSVPLHRRIFLLCKQVSIAECVLVMSRSSYPLPLLVAGSRFGLDLCRPCAGCHSLWVHMCTSPFVSGKLCFLGVIHHSGFTIFLLLLHRYLSLDGNLHSYLKLDILQRLRNFGVFPKKTVLTKTQVFLFPSLVIARQNP